MNESQANVKISRLISRTDTKEFTTAFTANNNTMNGPSISNNTKSNDNMTNAKSTTTTTSIRKECILQHMNPSLFFSPVPGNYQQGSDNASASQPPLQRFTSRDLSSLIDHYQLDDRKLVVRNASITKHNTR
mmetsp:Transcript_22923/g.33834  ORF Transcript_22923/g.33834 Transcript_22923/m.33834 type:complete len:132 (+) Transcript_22923:6-401(+)